MNAGRKILIVGDSHAKGFLPHSKIDSDAIGIRLGSPAEMRIAISGSTAEQWASDFNMRLTLAQLAAQDAEATLISLGGNDLFKAAQDGHVEDAEIAALCCHVFHVLEELALPSKRTFVLLYGYPFMTVDAHKLMAVTRLNAFIAGVARTVAALHGVRIETLDERMILIPEDWPGDDIHPFESGYIKIAEEILRRLDS